MSQLKPSTASVKFSVNRLTTEVNDKGNREVTICRPYFNLVIHKMIKPIKFSRDGNGVIWDVFNVDGATLYATNRIDELGNSKKVFQMNATEAESRLVPIASTKDVEEGVL